MGKRLQSSQADKLGAIQSTSAQLALTLAISCYTFIFGKLTRENFFNSSGQIDHDKLVNFSKRLKVILYHLLNQESINLLFPRTENDNSPASKKPKNYTQKSIFPFNGKLKYFDENHKVILSQRGIDELSGFLVSLDIQSDQDIHGVNEYNPNNSAPLSGRRLAASSSLMNSVGTLWAFAVILNEDSILSAQNMDCSSAATFEGITSITISTLFSILIVANLLKLDRGSRTNYIVAEYRAACVHALLNIQDQQNPPQCLIKNDETTYNNSEEGITDSESSSSSSSCDSSSLTASELLPSCIQQYPADKDCEQGHKAYMPLSQDEHPSASVLLTQEDWTLDNTIFDTANNAMNVVILKGAISAEAGRIRSNRTLLPAIVISAVFLGIDIATSGVSLAMRVGLGVLVAVTASIVRYEVKKQEVQKKLYAKVHRHNLNPAFQKRLLSELAVYGLQPANTYEETPLLSATHVNIKRQVEVDVEAFIETLNIQNNKGEFSVQPNENNKDITSKFRCKIEPKEKLLKKLSIYVRNHVPETYRQKNTYFVKEFIFQMRAKCLDENTQIITAEREQCFCPAAAKITAQYDNISIQNLNKEIMVYQSQQPSENEKLVSEKILVLDHDAVLKKINSNLNWNPWLATITSKQKHYEEFSQKNPSAEAEGEVKISQAKELQQALETSVRKKLSWSMGYAYYAATQFGQFPWQNNEKILNAYYEKRCADTRLKMAGEMIDKTSSFHHSSYRLFQDLIAEKQKEDLKMENDSRVIDAAAENTNGPQNTCKIGEKTLKQQYEDNMSGIAIASIIPAAASLALCATYPVLGYIADNYLATTIQAASYGVCSFFCKKRAIDYRRSCKNEARLTLESNSKI